MADRNYAGVQFSELRQSVEPVFNSYHDELETAYYQYWKNGISKDFHGFDKGETAEESKTKFDKLHQLIMLKLEIAFHIANLDLPEEERIPLEAYDVAIDQDGNPTGSNYTNNAIALTELEAEGYILEIE